MEKITLQLKVETEQWEVLREGILQFTQHHALTKQNEYHILLICEEWFINIVNHGFPIFHPVDKAFTEIEFELSFVGSSTNEVQMRFKDEGIPFNPFSEVKAVEKSASIEQELGGLGLYFVVNLLKQYEYSYSNNHNNAVMYYELKKENR